MSRAKNINGKYIAFRPSLKKNKWSFSLGETSLYKRHYMSFPTRKDAVIYRNEYLTISGLFYLIESEDDRFLRNVLFDIDPEMEEPKPKLEINKDNSYKIKQLEKEVLLQKHKIKRLESDKKTLLASYESFNESIENMRYKNIFTRIADFFRGRK